MNIVEFAESPAVGLGLTLYPVQRIILKIYAGIPLDDNEPFTFYHWPSRSTHAITEVDYLQRLYAEGRSNICKVEEGDTYSEIVLAAGRRGGRTSLLGIIYLYELYKLLMKEDPQAYYGIPTQSLIQLLWVGVDKDQSELAYSDFSERMKKHAFLSSRRISSTMTYARFQTKQDQEQKDTPTSKASIKTGFRSAIAKGLRGSSNLLAVLDDCTHFENLEEVYETVYPSIQFFFPKRDPNFGQIVSGTSEGHLILSSTPNGINKPFHQRFQAAMKHKTNLCLQIPTWEMNPFITAFEFDRLYAQHPESFDQEFGAQFITVTNNKDKSKTPKNKVLNLRIPQELQTRLDTLSELMSKRTGGVPPDMSKMLRHIIQRGMDQIERDFLGE